MKPSLDTLLAKSPTKEIHVNEKGMSDKCNWSETQETLECAR